MNADDFRRLERWFEQAVAAEPGARDAVLAACAEQNPELLPRLEAMLAVDGRSEDPLRRAVAGEAIEDSALPDRIGPFEVVRRLGAGGMGVVYLCRRSGPDFEQQVAVKRLPAALDSDFARQRLKLERRVLAGLRHPNIAQLVDGGEETDGTPWVAMEYVEGETVDRHVQRLKLDRRQRIALFLPLCEAVQFAHRNGVIHRDIKAANVLIDRHGQIKLLDFGIAKLLGDADAGAPAMTVAATMTPHYASPEQIRGEAVTQASDLYSLGVLLYELLADQRPYDFPTRRPAEIERIVSETEPPPLAGRNAADLDCIVRCAMHKDPARRYGSARALAEDLQHWLAGRPISARPDSALYRSGRFLRRHPFGAGASALILLLLAGFGASMAWQAHQLEIQRDVAQREARVAAETADFLIELFAVSDPRERNPADVRARDLLDAAAERLPQELETDPLARARLLHVIGLAFANLGDAERGIDLLGRALELRIRHGGEASAEVADSRNRLGNVLRRYGRLVEAEPLLLEALAWREANGPVDHDLADSWNNVGLLQNDLGHYQQAEATLRRSIVLHREAGGAETERVTAPLHNLSLALRRQGRLNEAREASLEALAIKQADPEWSQTSLAVTLAVLANIEREAGMLETALDYSNRALALREQVYGRDNVMIASGLVTHANVLLAQGDRAAGEALFREALELHRNAGSLDSLRAADIRLGLGRLLAEQGRLEQARPLLEQAAASARRELPDASPERARYEDALRLLESP